MSLVADKTLTRTTTSQIMSFNGPVEYGLVRETDTGRLWAVWDALGAGTEFLFYSDDNGVTWTKITSVFTPTQDFKPVLVFDASENLIIGIVSTDSTFRVYTRIKSTGVVSYVDFTIPSHPYGGPGLYIHGCAGSDGSIHFVKSCARYYGGGATANNIVYIYYKNGILSTRFLTPYDLNWDTSAFYDRVDHQDRFLKIAEHNGSPYIFWTVESYNNPTTTYASKYCKIPDSGYIDLETGAHAWATSRTYKVYSCVLQGGLYYECLVNHFSGTFSTDLAAGKWHQVYNTSPTVIYGPAATAKGPRSVRSNGKIYLVFGVPNGTAGSLYENFVDITPTSDAEHWGNWMDISLVEVFNNGDIIVYGGDRSVFNSPGAFQIRRASQWKTRNSSTAAGGPETDVALLHSYNMRKIY